MLNRAFHKKLRIFSRELQELSVFAEVSFAWHFVDNDCLLDIPREQTEHRHRFCAYIKGDPFRKLRNCVAFHHQEMFQKMRWHPEVRLDECHAHALLLSVPLMVSGRFFGILFSGPYKSGTENQLLLPELPYARRDKLEQLGAYLRKRMDNLFGDEPVATSENSLQTQVPFSDPRIGSAAHFMRTHCREKLTAAQTAKASGLSVSRFLHLFHEQTHYTFSDWLQRLRIAEACRLLEATSFKMGEIAEISGIRDQSRMSVLFRRYLRTTPLEYRQQHGFSEGHREKRKNSPFDL